MAAARSGEGKDVGEGNYSEGEQQDIGESRRAVSPPPPSGFA
jgi:hypothetical protein